MANAELIINSWQPIIMQFYTENYMVTVSLSIAPLQTNAHITLYPHVTYVPVDILKHNRQEEGGREREKGTWYAGTVDI